MGNDLTTTHPFVDWVPTTWHDAWDDVRQSYYDAECGHLHIWLGGTMVNVYAWEEAGDGRGTIAEIGVWTMGEQPADAVEAWREMRDYVERCHAQEDEDEETAR